MLDLLCFLFDAMYMLNQKVRIKMDTEKDTEGFFISEGTEGNGWWKPVSLLCFRKTKQN